MKYKRLPVKKSNQPIPASDLRLYILLGVVLIGSVALLSVMLAGVFKGMGWGVTQ